MSEAVYKNHAIRNTIKQILALRTDEEISRLPTLLTDEEQWQYDRIFEIMRIIEGNLDQTPSTLVSFSRLESLGISLGNVLSELTSFRTDKNLVHFTTIKGQIDDGVIPNLVAFVPKLKAIASGKFGEIVDDLRIRSHEAIKAITNEKDALSKQLAAQATLIAEQNARINELSLAVEVQKKEAVAITAVVQGKYAETETVLREKFETTLAGMEEKYAEFQLDTETKADTHLNELNKKEEKAKDILGLIGDQALTGNYKIAAGDQEKAANLWRLITLVVLGIAIIVGIATLFFYKHGESGALEVAGLRMLFAIVISFVALYTGRESARHRSTSDNARRVELELAILSPFLEELDTGSQSAIRTKLADRYFGNAGAPHEMKSPIDLKDAEGLLKAVSEIVGKIRKG